MTATGPTSAKRRPNFLFLFPDQHRPDWVPWNRDLPLRETVYSHVPTLFELAKKAGYTTAIVAGKSKFRRK